MGNILPRIRFITIITIIFSFVFSTFVFSQSGKSTKEAEAYRDKGYQAQRLGNLDMALSYYQQAIESNPDYPVVYNDIGIVMESKGKLQEAKDAYLKAISLDSNYLSAYYNLASLYEKEGNLEKAAYYWKVRVNLGDWSDSWTQRAREHLQSLEAKGITQTADPAISITPNPKKDAQYHIYRGRQNMADGDYVSALREFNAAMLLDPDNKDIEELLEDAQRKTLLYK